MSEINYPYDWARVPQVMAAMRAAHVRELIDTHDPLETVKIRARIQLLEELIRLPQTAHEEAEFQESTRSDIDD